MTSKKTSKKKRIPILDVSEPSVCHLLSLQIYGIILLIPNKKGFIFHLCHKKASFIVLFYLLTFWTTRKPIVLSYCLLGSLFSNIVDYFIFFSSLYSFLVIRMKLPCCGRATPWILRGFLKLRMFSSASQIR